MLPDNQDELANQANPNVLVSSPASAYVLLKGGPRIQEAHEGLLALTQNRILYLEQNNGQLAFQLPLENIVEVDFGFKLSPSAQFRIHDISDTHYTIMLDDIYKPQHSLLMMSQLLDLLLIKRRIRGMSSFAMWKRTFSQLLPAERFHKQSQMQQIPGAIALAIFIAFGLYCVFFAVAWFI